jgi:hypothetical protein
MRLRHAAALVLVGWYLMLPPNVPGKPPDIEASLSQWLQMGAFDSATACTKKRDSSLHLAKKKLAKIKREMESLPYTENQQFNEVAPKVYQDDLTASTFALQMQASRCIASDDPRLAK